MGSCGPGKEETLIFIFQQIEQCQLICLARLPKQRLSSINLNGSCRNIRKQSVALPHVHKYRPPQRIPSKSIKQTVPKPPEGEQQIKLILSLTGHGCISWGYYNHQFKAGHAMQNEMEQELSRQQQKPNDIQSKEKRIRKYRKLFLKRINWKTKITSVKQTHRKEYDQIKASMWIDSPLTSHSLDYFQFIDFQE